MNTFKDKILEMKSQGRGLEYEMLKRQLVAQDIQEIIDFIRNDSKQVLFLFDNSTKALPYLLRIKPMIQKVCMEKLDSRDQIGFECFNEVLTRITEVKRVRDFDQQLKQVISSAFVDMR